MSTTYLLVLLLGMVVLTTRSLGDYPEHPPFEKPPPEHKPPGEKPPPEHKPTPFEKPPKGEKPLPEHKPPTPVGKPPKGEKPLPENKPPTPVGKPPKGEKPPHYGHNPGHPPAENAEDSYKPPWKIKPPSTPAKKQPTPGKKLPTSPHKPPPQTSFSHPSQLSDFDQWWQGHHHPTDSLTGIVVGDAAVRDRVNDPDNYIRMVYAGHPDVSVEAVRMFYAYKCRLNFLEAVRI
uniref:Uncharacterized protein n=1 Tax=Vitis vinifera TaxID=29760 RepID=A5BEI6_VITVI|nr:hypothetical protein VITISV_043421 [Vitis vinifera]